MPYLSTEELSVIHKHYTNVQALRYFLHKCPLHYAPMTRLVHWTLLHLVQQGGNWSKDILSLEIRRGIVCMFQVKLSINC